MRSVRLTLTAPLSQLDALRLALSLPPIPAVLVEDRPAPAPSSKSIHGSISESISCCNDNGFVLPAVEAEFRAEETGFLCGKFDGGWDPETEMEGCSGVRAAGDTDGGWQEMDHLEEGKRIGIAAWIRHRIESGKCIRSKSFCAFQGGGELELNKIP